MISRTMPTRNCGYIGLYSLEEVRNMMNIPEILILQMESVGNGYFLVELKDCRKSKLLAISTIEDKMDDLFTKFQRYAYGLSNSDDDTGIDYFKGNEMSCLSNFCELLKEELNK